MFNPFRFLITPIIYYDENNRMTYYNDRKGTIKDFKYDNNGNLLEIIINNNYVEVHNEYDENGNMIYHREDNFIEQYEYDNKNRLIHYSNSKGDIQKIYYYDKCKIVYLKRYSKFNSWYVYSYENIESVKYINDKIQEYIDRLPNFLEEFLGKQV